MDYKEIEELVIEAKNGSMWAKERLVEEFKPFILNISKKTFIHGYDIYDLQNECYKGLFNAIRCYDIEKHRFVAYGTNAIKNAIYLLIRTYKRREVTDSEDAITFTGDLENLEISCEYSEGKLNKVIEDQALKEMLNELSKEEHELIDFVIFNDYSLKDYSKLKNIPYANALYKKKNILKKVGASILGSGIKINI